MQSEAERIAAGLTEAQRAMVLASDPDDMTGEEGCGVDLRGPEFRVARSLRGKGLGVYTHGSPFGNMYWNNATGLEVRAILERNRND